MDSYEDENGAEICICERHRLEYCGLCTFDFRDMNKTARQEAKLHKMAGCSAPQCYNSGTKICSRCKKARYCSSECQKLHWKTHKIMCKKPNEGNEAVNPPQTFRTYKGIDIPIHENGTRCRMSAKRLKSVNDSYIGLEKWKDRKARTL
jgi:hypothetical protein